MVRDDSVFAWLRALGGGSVTDRVKGWLSWLLLTVSVAVAFYVGVQNREMTQDGAATHDAVCAWRADLQRRADENEAFLKMTLDERVEKYGTALGRTPTTFVENSLNNQNETLKSFNALEC